MSGKPCFSIILVLKDYLRVNQFCQLRDIANQLFEAELKGDEKAMTGLRSELNLVYDQFVFSYGVINNPVNKRVIGFDVEGFKLLSLEKRVKENDYIKSDIFTIQVNNVERKVVANSIQDAIVLSLNANNRIDVPFIADILDRTEIEVIKEGLHNGLFYFVPTIDGYEFVTKDAYLSGNIVKKLSELERVVKTKFQFMSEDDWNNQLQKLESVRPAILPRALIDINMGVNWVPLEVYQSFAAHVFECDVSVKYLKSTNNYSLELLGNSNVNDITLSAKTDSSIIAGKFIWEYAMQDQLPKLTIKIDEQISVPDIAGMKAVESKCKAIKKMWDDYSTNIEGVAKRLAYFYNTHINNVAPRIYNGSHLTFPALEKYDPKWNQLDAVWKILQEDGALCDHVVGAGKTLVIVLAAMKMKQLGLANKSLVLCLKANVGAIAADFRKAYPDSKILAPSEKDFTPQGRKAVFASIMSNDWDAVIMTHENFQRIPQDPVLVKRMMQDEIDTLQKDLDAVKGDQALSKRVLKGLELRKINLSVKLQEIEVKTKRDDYIVNFKAMGFDHLFVDESHEFKNLPFTTRQSNVSGLGVPEGSGRARNLLYAVRTVQERKGGDKGVTFLSGTPISNSLVELYLLKKYLRPNKLKDPYLNLTSFDAWAKMFARKSSTFEFSVTGEIKSKVRYREFINLPELSMWYKDMAHIVLGSDIKEDRPTINNILVNTDPTDAQQRYIQRLILFSQTKDGMHVGLMLSDSQKQAYMLLATSLASKMSIDMRLIDPSYLPEDSSKISTMCSMVSKKYYHYDNSKGAQLIFSDIGTPGGKGYNIYQAIKENLVNNFNIPAETIAFAQEYNTKAKANIFEKKLNNGEIRIAIGSTKTLGTGKNVQKRLVAIHHIDVPWTPKDVEQRNGRGVRQGAIIAKEHCNNIMECYYYATNRSLDAYKYTVLSNKQKFIDQIKSSATSRTIDEGGLDQENGMSYNEYVAELSGNKDLLKKAQIEKKISGIEQDWNSFQSQQYDNLMRKDSEKRGLEKDKEAIVKLKADFAEVSTIDMENMPLIIKEPYSDKRLAGERLLRMVKNWIGETSETIARQGVFNLTIEKKLMCYENGRPKFTNLLKVISNNGMAYNYADGLLNENPALAGRYILDSIRRLPQVIEVTEARITNREHRIKTFDTELKNVFQAADELLKLQNELKGIEDRINGDSEAVKNPTQDERILNKPIKERKVKYKQ